MKKLWEALHAKVYFRVVCMWSYQPWYVDLAEDGTAKQPVSYHRELQWPIHLGVCWIPRAGNFCIDLIAWRIFLSVDPVWEKKKMGFAPHYLLEAKEALHEATVELAALERWVNERTSTSGW